MTNHFEPIASIDIGGTKVAVVIAGPQGPITRVTEATAVTGNERALPEQAIALIGRACVKAGIDPERIRHVGVASCGPFVRVNGLLFLATPNICGRLAPTGDLPNDWEQIPLEQVLRERFDRVVIENDGVAALCAERTFGAVVDEPNCVYATWSTGVGFGLCVDGRILHGKHGNAGHGGHMLMSEVQPALCGCGNRGDLEALISGRNLGAHANMRTVDLFGAARNGDAQANTLVEEAARWFGRALYNFSAILDTRVFVIGGSVWEHHGDLLLPIVMQEIESRFPALTHGVKIVPARLGGLVADLGALSLVAPDEWVDTWRKTTPWQALSG